MAPLDPDNEIMTVTEVAQYLQLAEKTILRMAQAGKIPAAKIASQWRFMRPVVRDWLAGQMQMAPAELLEGAAQARRMLPLSEVVRPELMNLSVSAGPKEHILRQLVTPLVESGFIAESTSARLLGGLVERERMMTTAVGHGIALPHPRRTMEGAFSEPALAIGICSKGTHFGAVDDQLVHVFFLICSTREEIHLQLMAGASWLARREGVIVRLREARTAAEVTEIVATEEQHLQQDRTRRKGGDNAP